MITDFVLRISGLVTFEDNHTNKFCIVFEDGALVDPFDSESLEAFRQLWQEKNVQIKALLQMLGGHYTLTPGNPSVSRVVNDWTFLLDGRITRDDRSHGNFNAVFDLKGGSRVTGSSIYAEVLANTVYKANLRSALNVLTNNHTTITA